MFGLNKKPVDLTDEQLMKKLIAGDAVAFNQLYQRYNQRLLYYFYRMLGNSNEKAQDFLQDIFMILIDKAGTFDPSRKFSTWIFSIAHNLCKNEYRRLHVRQSISLDGYTDSASDEGNFLDGEEKLDVDQFAKDVFEELNTFDEMHKTVFLLHYREAFPIREIAQILEISEGTVKSRLFYTRRRLSERLTKYKPDFL
jgi:RNA polymerase sigma-70 factor, ECF subfamily